MGGSPGERHDGMKFERWRKAAQKAGRWFRRVEEGAEAFMRKRHHAESCRVAERQAKAAAAPPTVGIYTRQGGWGASCSRDSNLGPAIIVMTYIACVSLFCMPCHGRRRRPHAQKIPMPIGIGNTEKKRSKQTPQKQPENNRS